MSAKTACNGSRMRSGCLAGAPSPLSTGRAVCASIDVESGEVVWLHRFPAWHAAPDRSGNALRLRHEFSRCRSARHPARRPADLSLRQRGEFGRRALGPARFPITTALLRLMHVSTPIRIRVFRPTVRALSSRRITPATPKFMKSNLTERRHERRQHPRKPTHSSGNPRRAHHRNEPRARALVSCSAIWPSCRRHSPSISCSIASAISAPVRCWKSPTQAIRCRISSRLPPICAPIARATLSSLTANARPTVPTSKICGATIWCRF